MLKRIFALLILALLVVGVLYYRRTGSFKFGSFPTPSLKLVGGIKDVALSGSIRAAFGLNKELRGYPLEVDASEGTVVLKGSLPSPGLRTTAEQIASEVPNVRKVVNGIRIDPSVQPSPSSDRSLGENLDDHTLEMQVKLALALKKGLEGSKIDVLVYKKAVTLSGEARPSQRTIALETARQTPGVSGVTDGFAEGGLDLGRARVAAERALSKNPNLARYGIKVVERDGHLALVGRVSTGAERDLAGLLAERAAGFPIENALEKTSGST